MYSFANISRAQSSTSHVKDKFPWIHKAGHKDRYINNNCSSGIAKLIFKPLCFPNPQWKASFVTDKRNHCVVEASMV